MDPETELARWMDDRRGRVETRLGEILPRASLPPASLHEAMRYSVLGGGKRLRPLLCLAAYEAVGGAASRAWVVDGSADAPESAAASAVFPASAAAVAVYGGGAAPAAAALDAGCAVEILHAYSLVHDDLPAMDDDDLRRGRLATHKAFGEAAAILAGDALLTLSFGVLAGALAGERARQAVALLAQAAGSLGMCGGQMLDLEGENKPATPAAVEVIDRWKTGALIACACELGALAAGADDARRRAVTEYGRQVGSVFQIVDDILDVTGSAQSLGKTPGKDRRAGKQTYVEAMGLEGARTLARERTDAALSALIPLGSGPGPDRLRVLARRLIGRQG